MTSCGNSTRLLSTNPVIGLEAPNSLWNLLEPYRDGPRNLARAVARFVAEELIEYPVLLGEDSADVVDQVPKTLWPINTTCKDSLPFSELNWAAKHLALQRSNTLFPCPFEHQVLWENRDELLPLAAEVDLLAHRFSNVRQMIAPKATVGTRIASQLDPLDALLLTALVITCGTTVERARVPIEDGIVHSFRFKPEDWGGLWDSETGFASFEEASDFNIQSDKVEFVVEADVSEFYHRIPGRLVGVQFERMGIHPRRAECIARLLESVANVGIPVGPSVSAFLGEAVMAAVDNQLLSRGVRYVRFNDDFRFFCCSELQAREQLAVLEGALTALGLSMQREKTRICDATKYLEERHESREWWLRKLGREVITASDYEEAAKYKAKFSESAMAVLLKSIDGEHAPWLKLGRQAFRAITPEQKSNVIPHLLAEIERVWAFASDIAMALRYDTANEEWSELSGDVPGSLAVGASKASDQQTLEFALIWILDALQRRDWPERALLAPLLRILPTSSAARRELVMALKDVVDDSLLSLYGGSRWVDRCQARLGLSLSAEGTAVNETAAAQFETALTDAITAEQ